MMVLMMDGALVMQVAGLQRLHGLCKEKVYDDLVDDSCFSTR